MIKYVGLKNFSNAVANSTLLTFYWNITDNVTMERY